MFSAPAMLWQGHVKKVGGKLKTILEEAAGSL
jgi:hypothetical protein